MSIDVKIKERRGAHGARRKETSSNPLPPSPLRLALRQAHDRLRVMAWQAKGGQPPPAPPPEGDRLKRRIGDSEDKRSEIGDQMSVTFVEAPTFAKAYVSFKTSMYKTADGTEGRQMADSIKMNAQRPTFNVQHRMREKDEAGKGRKGEYFR